MFTRSRQVLKVIWINVFRPPNDPLPIFRLGFTNSQLFTPVMGGAQRHCSVFSLTNLWHSLAPSVTNDPKRMYTRLFKCPFLNDSEIYFQSLNTFRFDQSRSPMGVSHYLESHFKHVQIVAKLHSTNVLVTVFVQRIHPR